MWFNKLRERINLSIYNSKDFVFSFLRFANMIVAASMIAILIYYYGFPQTIESKTFLTGIIKLSFIYYIIRFFIKLTYSFNIIRFFKENKFETGIIIMLISFMVLIYFYNDAIPIKEIGSLGGGNIADITNIVIQVFFIAYVISDIFKKTEFKQYFKIHPGLLFMLSILTIILVGTGLLTLPEMTHPGMEISWIDRLFLSTSATSVTGLSTVDITNVLTLKGQVVVLFLIQIGALNTIAFAALYILIAKIGVGVKQHDVIEDFVNKFSFIDTDKIFYRIVKWTLFIELIGFVLIFLLFEAKGIFENTSTRLFHALYQSVSSFCNAGLSSIPNGLMNAVTVDSYLLHIITFVLFFLGGFGMVYLFDFFGIRNLRKRMKYPWKTLRFDTKIVLYTTLFLLASGALVFYVFEHDRLLAGKSGVEAFITTLFSSMTTRSAGFSTVDMGSLSLPVLVFFLFLMFVGASSGSTGGGIRVSTFAIMMSSVVSTIKRKPHVEIFKRTIDNELVLKAYSVFIFFIVGNIIGIFALLVTEYEAIDAGRFHLENIIFEHVSAMSTVGLTTGITQDLTQGGKIVLIVAMFIGRVGTLTIAYLLGKQVLSRKYKYPKGHIMIG